LKREASRLAVCHPEFLEDLRHWVETDRRTARRLLELVEAVLRDPFDGIGKPEPLKENLTGFWSRRIDDTNRLIYCVDGGDLVVIACRYHYQQFS